MVENNCTSVKGGENYHFNTITWGIESTLWNIRKKWSKARRSAIKNLVLSLNNCRFGDIVDHIYPIELLIKDTTDTNDTDMYASASSLHKVFVSTLAILFNETQLDQLP
jgi:hypothetical protein